MYNFYILETISKFPGLSQKGIAEKCDISAGKVNYTINHLLEEGLIEVKKESKKYEYLLTDAGKDYLKRELETLQETKVSIHTEQKKEVKNAVILAGGFKNDFMEPACLIPVHKTNLLERTIGILERNGIENIVIVTGYKSWAFDAFEFIKNDSKIHLVHNDEYQWTGSMASLAAAKELVYDDFLLIEDDILIEENAIKQLIEHPQRDCMLVTKESGSGDEGYIEIRNGYLYKISKDIHQLNRIDGEMVGITKLSYDVYQEMLKEYQDNKNPLLHYEYLLLDVSRKINIGYLKISDMIWAEIDNNSQLKTVVDKVYPMLLRKEALFKEAELKATIANALGIDIDAIKEVKPFGGMTNKNFKAVISEEEYVVRVPGSGTELMINRKEEKVNSLLGASIGLNPDLLYFDENTGLKITRLIPNPETLNPKTSRRKENRQAVADLLQRLHHPSVKMANDFDIFGKLANYENLTIEVGGSFYDDYETVKASVMELKKYHESLNVTYTACHNDPNYANFVKSHDEERMYLIDWEYAGMNDPLWDVSNFTMDALMTEEEEDIFLTEYYGEPPTVEIKQRMLINKIYQDFLWTVWTLYKEACGDDFGPYGIERYNRAKEYINKFHELYKGVEAIEK